MANNCWNNISIEGSKKDIKNLYKELSVITSGYELYHKLLHEYKEGVIGDDAKWFDMFVTKDNDEEITVSGDSAWCPSLELFAEISVKYNTLKIIYMYDEMGCDFCGRAFIQGGDIDDECLKYWEGQIKYWGLNTAVEMFIENEVDCYDTLDELKSCSHLKFFPQESVDEIISTYKQK